MNDATICDTLLQVSEQQERAIELILAGQRDGAVAESIGVHRTTVTRWRNSHPGFIAALNSCRQENFKAASERLQSLSSKAIEALERALSRDDVRLSDALRAIELLGISGESMPKRDDPREVLNHMIDCELHQIQSAQIAHLSDTDRSLAEFDSPTPEEYATDRDTARQNVMARLARQFKADLENHRDAQ